MIDDQEYKNLVIKLNEVLAKIRNISDDEKKSIELSSVLLEVKSLARSIAKELRCVYVVPEWIQKKRLIYPNAYKAWSEQEDINVVKYFKEGKSALEIAHLMGRSEFSIFKRLVKFGLVKEEKINDENFSKEEETEELCECSHCGKLVSVEDLTEQEEGGLICESCAEEMRACDNCDKMFFPDTASQALCEECDPAGRL